METQKDPVTQNPNQLIKLTFFSRKFKTRKPHIQNTRINVLQKKDVTETQMSKNPRQEDHIYIYLFRDFTKKTQMRK